MLFLTILFLSFNFEAKCKTKMLTEIVLHFQKLKQIILSKYRKFAQIATFYFKFTDGIYTACSINYIKKIRSMEYFMHIYKKNSSALE